MKAPREKLEEIEGIGGIIADAIIAWREDKVQQKTLSALLPHIKINSPARQAATSALTGKTFVFTGSLAHFTREEAGARVRALGASVASSVSKKTSYVVAGNDPGSKATQAEKLGVTILDETAFEKLLKEAL